VLFGDSGLRQVLSSLRLGLMEPVSVGNTAAIDELAEIGVSTGAASAVSAEKNNGRLVFDEAKFTAAWEGGAGAGSVERLLRGAGDLTGYAQRLDGLIKPLTETGGLFDGRITASNGELTRLKDGLARMDARLERKESFYRAQFTALETALQRMQTQGAELASRLPQQKD
jgi:flagellar hook-associated protein 2